MASSTEPSGAVPMRIAARDGPAQRTAKMNAICERPGTTKPTTANGHSSPASIPSDAIDGTARSVATRKASDVMTTPPRAGSPPRSSPARTATIIAPKSAPASRPSRTASMRSRYRKAAIAFRMISAASAASAGSASSAG